MFFVDILEKKKAFLDSKIRKLKKSQNRDISKGVVQGFGKTFGDFSIFLVLVKSDRKMCLMKNFFRP